MRFMAQHCAIRRATCNIVCAQVCVLLCHTAGGATVWPEEDAEELLPGPELDGLEDRRRREVDLHVRRREEAAGLRELRP